jgi:DNA-directed RNA polymerase subunit alpha
MNKELLELGLQLKNLIGSKSIENTFCDYPEGISVEEEPNCSWEDKGKYQVENFRVEQKTDYEKLVLEITTDGSIHPKEALKEAAKILIYHFMLFSDEKITLETSDVDGNEEFDEEVLHMRQLLKTKLVDMDLSVRALNCLKAADVETLGDLVQFNKTDLLKFRNFGKKSLTELDDLLEGLNLSFGTDISKYKLDKE